MQKIKGFKPFQKNGGVTLMSRETKKIEVSGVAQERGTAKSSLVVDFKPSLCNEFQVVNRNWSKGDLDRTALERKESAMESRVPAPRIGNFPKE